MTRRAAALLVAAAAASAWTIADAGLADIGCDEPLDAEDSLPVVSQDEPCLLAAMPVWGRAAAADRHVVRPSIGAAEGKASDANGPEQRVLPLRVSVVDADFGAPIRGATWTADCLDPGGCCERPLPPEHEADEEAPLQVGSGFGPPPFASCSAPTSQREQWISWQTPNFATVSRYATRLVATAILHHEADLALTVARDDGVDGGSDPATELRVVASVADRLVENVRAELAGREVRVRGVPFVRGATWHVGASAQFPDGCREAATSGVFVGGPYTPTRARLEFYRPEVIGLGGGAGGTFKGRCGCRRIEADLSLPVGDLTLTVRRRDGRPAEHAWVYFRPHGDSMLAAERASRDPRWRRGEERADERGVVRWLELPAGTWRISLGEPGLVPSVALVEVVAGVVTMTTLKESVGGVIHLYVVDAGGEPVPFASVSITQPSKVDWLDVADGDVQRLDDLTDVNGRRTLSHIEPGAVELRVEHGGRTWKRTVHLDDGATERVTAQFK